MITNWRIYFVAFGMFSALQLRAQTDPGEYKVNIIPPSPEAAALGKYGSIPVSYYTGVPEITIPLFSLKGRQIEVPLALSYHAGGNKVEEIPSWVGLGFSLQAGGVITRTIRGIKDEASAGYMHISDQLYAEMLYCGGSNGDEIVDGLMDSQPDLFYFNVNGISGKFYFDHYGNVQLETPQFYILTPEIVSEEIVGWTLVTDDGFTYTFESIEVTRTRSHQLEPYVISNSSWYLTKITAPNKLEEALFYYDQVTLPDYEIDWSMQAYTSFNPYAGDCPGGEMMTCPSFETKSRMVINHTTRRLSKIVTAQHEAIFKADFDRLDVPGTKALSEIYIKNIKGDTLKSFRLTHDHFESTSGEGKYKYRLKLLKVTEVGYESSSPTIEKPPFEFQYNEQYSLPHRKSNAQDYWGFYNGKNTNTTLIPGLLYNYNGSITEFEGADRETYGNLSLANILTQVKYPSGGRTVFEYETHQYSYIYPELISEPVFDNREATVDAISFGTACEPADNEMVQIDTIQINADQIVRFLATLDQCVPAIPSLMPKVWVEDDNGVELVSFTLTKNDANDSFDKYIPLPAGTYYLYGKVRIHGDRASATLRYKTQVDTTHIKTAGGARIKRISSYSDNGVLMETKYSYEDTIGISSGVLVTRPIHSHNQVLEKIISCEDGLGGSTPHPYSCSYFVRSSHSQLPMGMTSGSHVGYRKVTVTMSGNGQEKYYFTSAMDYPDVGDETYPFVAKTNQDWARGKLLASEVLAEDGQVLKRTSNYYSFQNLGSAKGYVYRKVYPWSGLEVFECKAYDQVTAFAQLDSTVEESITGSGSISLTTIYTYDSIKGSLPVTVATKDSEGRMRVTTIRYPFNSNTIPDLSTGELAALNQMVSANIVSIPIEKINTVGSTTELKDRSNFHVEAVSNPDFPLVNSMIVKQTREIAKTGDDYVTYETFSNYDDYGNPKQYSTIDGVKNTFVWLPVEGKILAYAENSVAGDVAYSSFEDVATKGNWDYTLSSSAQAKMGMNSHQIAGSPITKSGLDVTKTYIVSFWAKDGVPSVTNVVASNDDAESGSDNWRYFEKTISNATSVTITGTGTTVIDALRLYPQGARMTAYSYLPGIGMVGTMDTNNRVARYEYDDFGRLKLVRDHEGNILKTYEYNYQLK